MVEYLNGKVARSQVRIVTASITTCDRNSLTPTGGEVDERPLSLYGNNFPCILKGKQYRFTLFHFCNEEVLIKSYWL